MVVVMSDSLAVCGRRCSTRHVVLEVGSPRDLRTCL